jgi:hypothetical protein
MDPGPGGDVIVRALGSPVATAPVVKVCRPTPVKIFFSLQLQNVFFGVILLTVLRVGGMVLCVVWMF